MIACNIDSLYTICFLVFQIECFLNVFLLMQIAKLQSLDSDESENWAEGFNISSVVEGKIQEVKDIGVVVSFEKYNHVLGFITHYQCKSFDEHMVI